MNKKRLRLYVWTGFCPDYTSGLAFAIAENEAEARKLVEGKLGHQVYDWGNLNVYPLHQKRAAAVAGGG